MKVLGVSGSPIKNSNTDRALKIALEATGLRSEFIKLSDYKINPCNACLGCVETNRCILEDDDGIFLAEKTFRFDALIVAGFTPYSTLDSRTKAYLERLYPLRHRQGLMTEKPGGAIVTSAVPPGNKDLPPAAENGLDAIKYYMMEEGMHFVGGVTVGGNVPCVKCGHEKPCMMSGIKMIYGREATPESVGINDVEDNPDVVAALRKLGEDIGNFFFR